MSVRNFHPHRLSVFLQISSLTSPCTLVSRDYVSLVSWTLSHSRALKHSRSEPVVISQDPAHLFCFLWKMCWILLLWLIHKLIISLFSVKLRKVAIFIRKHHWFIAGESWSIWVAFIQHRSAGNQIFQKKNNTFSTYTWVSIWKIQILAKTTF